MSNKKRKKLGQEIAKLREQIVTLKESPPGPPDVEAIKRELESNRVSIIELANENILLKKEIGRLNKLVGRLSDELAKVPVK